MVRQQGKRRRQKGDSHKNNDDDELLNIYANPRAPGSFSGAATLKHYSGRSDADVKNFSPVSMHTPFISLADCVSVDVGLFPKV